jgi:hypothetical protein
MTGSTYLAYYTVLGSVGMITAVLLGLWLALTRANWPAAERSQVLTVAALTLIVWFAATATLAWLGAYQGGRGRIPTIQFGLLVPILIGAALIWRSPAAGRVLDAVPQHWLVGVQFYRVLGAIFVVLYAAGSLPGAFALPAGLGDLAVGVLALIVAWSYARAPSQSAGLVRWWNSFGLGDLALAFATGFMTAPSPFQLLALDAPNTMIDAFPLVLIPVFLVPLSVLLHIASLTKLHRDTALAPHASPTAKPA